MPAAESTIRTVPGGNAGPVAVGGSATGPSSSGAGPPPSTATSTRTTTTMRASPLAPMSTAVRRERAGGSGGRQDSQASGDSAGRAGASNGVPTETPGPAGVVTSDHEPPSHQRTSPGAPSGSGYQPGAAVGCPDVRPGAASVTESA